MFQARFFFYQNFFVASWFILLHRKWYFPFNLSIVVTVLQETFFHPFPETNSVVVFIIDEFTARLKYHYRPPMVFKSAFRTLSNTNISKYFMRNTWHSWNPGSNSGLFSPRWTLLGVCESQCSKINNKKLYWINHGRCRTCSHK